MENRAGQSGKGNVETVCEVKRIKKVDKSNIVEVKIKKTTKNQLVAKAARLINGVARTRSKIKKDSFEIGTIPHTRKLTNLITLKKNEETFNSIM